MLFIYCIKLPCNPMPHTVYILKCNDGSLYVGCTNNFEKRIKEHNESKNGAHYTKIRRPVVIKYTEKFKTLAEARRREAELKKWKRQTKEILDELDREMDSKF